MNPQTLAKYIYTNYDESFQFLQKRKQRQVAQIRLLNNLQKGDETIASTMLITLFLRVLSNNYDDKPQVKFIPGEEMDQKKVNSINILAQNDYRELDKDKMDYDIMWDTLFFGTGYWETLRFDKQRKIPRPQVLNPLMLGYDPYEAEVDNWRYYWKWRTLNKWQIIKLIQAKKLINITRPEDIPSGIDPYLWDYKVKREEAKSATPQANDTSNAEVYQILEYLGYDEEGNKAIFWTDRDISKVIYYEKLDLQDGEGILAPDGTVITTNSKWPLVRKFAFKEPHSTVNFSVADLLEDKHRAESVLLNLAFIAAKDKANPIYKYVPDNIIDLSQLFNRQISQHIPVKQMDNSVEPLQTANPMDSGLMAFIQVLNQKANDPMGTGMALNPTKKGKQSATETAIQQQLNDLAQSLQSKVLKFGEEEFWSHWYQRYKRYSKAGDEKIATVVGVKGMTFENIDLGDIRTKYPPGIQIYSAKEAEYKELVLRRELTQLRSDLANQWTPDQIREFDKNVLLPKYLQDPRLIETLVPDTADELQAKAENEMFDDKKFIPAKETDNHEQHLAVHYMAPNSWGKWIHIEMHKEMLGLQKKQQMEQQMNPEGQMKPEDQNPEEQGNKPQFKSDKMDEKSSASPKKQEISSAPKS